MGKTTLAMNFALNAAVQSNAGVAVFSLEMPKEQLARMLSSEAKVDMSHFDSQYCRTRIPRLAKARTIK